MKFYFSILLLSATLMSFAQKIEKDGKKYNVKKEKIYLNGQDVTNSLSTNERESIFTSAMQKLKTMENDKAKKAEEKAEKQRLKAEKKAQKQQEKAEKKAQKAEKEKTKAEKTLEKVQKRQDRLKKAEDKLAKAQSKYNKLKTKGKLSPEEDTEWNEKIQRLTDKVNKTKSKL